MDAKSVLFSLMGNLRRAIKADDYTATIAVTAYLFWCDPAESVTALQRGERRVQEYVQERVRQLEIDALYTVKGGEDVALSPIFELYAELYKKLEDSREEFATFIVEGLFTGITMQHGDTLDSGSTVELIAEIAKTYAPTSVYDGAAGLGRLLYLIDPPKFIAKELNSEVGMVGSLLFKMLGRDGVYQLGDTLQSAEKSRQVDLVVSQPPFGLRLQGKHYSDQPYLITSGRVPSSGSDSLWIQEALYQAKDDGRVILQVATGWLFRGGYDLAVRQELIERNWLEAIIYLPEQILTNTSIETALLIFNKGKMSSGVKLINAQDLGEKRRVLCQLSEEEIQRVVAALNEPVDEMTKEEDFVKEITIREIANNDYELNRNLYFLKKLEIEVLTIAEEQMMLTEAMEKSVAVQKEFITLLEELATDSNRD